MCVTEFAWKSNKEKWERERERGERVRELGKQALKQQNKYMEQCKGQNTKK